MTAERVALGVVCAGFAIGATTHAADFVRYGWFPYRFGPPLANLFWNALLFLDLGICAAILSGRRRTGLCAGLAVMVVDVAVNVWAWRTLWPGMFAGAIMFQTAFLGFLLGTLGFLWPRSSPR